METLAEIANANEWERRLQALVSRINETPGRFVNRRSILKWRARIIEDMRTLRPNRTEIEVSNRVDGVFGLDK